MSALDPITISSGAELPPAKPRLGFLGVGWIGFRRMAAIAESGLAEIAAIADPAEELVLKAAEHAPAAAQLRTLQDLLEAGLDGVVIATPSALHAAQTVSALDRGLAVFCQKPLGRDTAEVRAAIDAAQRADRLLGVDLSYRFTEALQKIRALIQAGELGRIFAADLVFHNAYGPQKPWFYDPQQSGGGCVVDLGIHLVDAALWMLESPVIGVKSRLFHQGKPITTRGEVCEDYATARLELENGAVVNLTCSWNLHAGQDAVIKATFYGTQGGAAMCNQNGSFVDFAAEQFAGTSRLRLCEPPDAWGGRAAVDWARRLAASRHYDPEIERLITVTQALDAIYAGATEP
jgi:predicted dehydrogenase